MSEAALQAIVAKLEQVTARLEKVAVGGSSPTATAASSSAGGSAFVDEYASFLSGTVANFVALTGKLNIPELTTSVGQAHKAFQLQLGFVKTASVSKKPTQEVLSKLLAETSTLIGQIQSDREANRKSKFFNHLSSISEGIPALGWVAVEPKPAPFIKDFIDAAQFYTNRVIKDHKDTDAIHVEWAKAWVALLMELHEYVKKSHTTGVSWNAKGGDATAAPATTTAPATTAAAPATAAKPAGDAAAVKAGLFSELSSKGNVTSGLKHVDKSQMTHKNPELRASSVVAASAPSAPAVSKVEASAVAVSKPAKTELQGNKWVVEYHKGNKNIVIEDTSIKQTVYIFKCTDSTIQVKGKLNSIILDSCIKTAVVFDVLVGSIELVNCKSVQAQAIGKVPTVSIDKTDGAQVYLSKDSIDAHIVSAKSSEMNVLIPTADGSDYVEHPLPEQYKTVWDGKKFVTTINDI